jgi:hypothetical protein
MGSFERCVRALGSYYFLPHILFVATFAILRLLPGPKKQESKNL